MLHPGLPIGITPTLEFLSQGNIRQIPLHDVDLLHIGVHKRHSLRVDGAGLPALEGGATVRVGGSVEDELGDVRAVEGEEGLGGVVEFELLHFGEYVI